jgi:hypothetical protein
MNQPVPNKFVLDESAEEPTPRLGDAELEVIDVHEDGNVIVECDHGTLANASLEAFPDALTVHIHSPDGFGAFLFHEAKIYRDDVGQLVAEHICHQPNKYWEGTWGLAALLGAIKDQLPFFPTVTLGDIELDDDWKRLSLRMLLNDGSAAQALHANADILKRIMR